MLDSAPQSDPAMDWFGEKDQGILLSFRAESFQFSSEPAEGLGV